jgi:hypothetical protein
MILHRMQTIPQSVSRCASASSFLCTWALWLFWVAASSGCSTGESDYGHRRPAGDARAATRFESSPPRIASSATATLLTKDFAEELYALVEVEFDTATLLKPPRISETPLDDLIRSLAPLVEIQQAAEAGAPPLHSNSDPSAHHAPALTILTAEDSVAIHGVEYRCISFAGFESGSCTNSDPAWILRLTLDDLGFPMVFEVQEPRDGGVDRVFAARSLESAAAATFGGG